MENSSLKESARLPRNFHKTFIPERRYIRDMLQFAAGGKSGDYQKIAQETGIPMGKSTGKVPAILDYCRGMGMLAIDRKSRSSVKSPELTPFGRIVLLEDSLVSERITQLIAHFNLCSPDNGADAWYHVFFQGRYILGMRFGREQLSDYLADIYGIPDKNLIGPMIRMYQDDASFLKAGILSATENEIERYSAPLVKEYSNAFAAWILSLMEYFFPKSNQITITEFERVCGWQSISGWSDAQVNEILSLLEAKRAIDVDRQMQPWIIRKKGNSGAFWPRMYEDLI